MPIAVRSWTTGLLASVVVSTSAVAQRAREPEELVLALGLIDRGLHAEAIPRLEAFLERQPRHRRAGEAWYRLGVCQVETDASDRAVDSFRRALRTNGFELDAEARYRLATTLQPGDPGAARGEFEALLERIDESHYLRAAALFGRGECERDTGQDEKAARSFQRLLLRCRGRLPWHCFLARS